MASIPGIPTGLPSALLNEIRHDIAEELPVIETDLAKGEFHAAETAIGVLAKEIATDIIDYFVTCFASGTLITTDRGDVSVDKLRVGDLALVSSGRYRRIGWIGSKAIKCRTHRDPQSVQPVRIAAHAFGPNRPNADLFLSPGHAIGLTMVEEILIPVSALVNGSTIARTDVAEITYWHVELDEHDIVFANGLPAESYLECGHRAWFEQSAHVGSSEASHMDRPAYCRRFVENGPLVVACRDLLFQRALELGWTLDPTMDMHLLVDGQRLDPVREGDFSRFHIPAGAHHLQLASSTFVPAWLEGGDERVLGLCVKSMRVTDGLSYAADASLDDASLESGFHQGEAERGLDWRWTKGDLTIPQGLLNNMKQDVFLSIETSRTGSCCWIAPVLPMEPAARVHPEVAEAA